MAIQDMAIILTTMAETGETTTDKIMVVAADVVAITAEAMAGVAIMAMADKEDNITYIYYH